MLPNDAVLLLFGNGPAFSTTIVFKASTSKPTKLALLVPERSLKH
jgi:hypothetical protein